MWVWLAAEALAESWCAAPLTAHEWGVEVLRADGARAVGVPMPSWFHRGGTAPTGQSPVRDLPPDSGIRTLPVVQLYASGGFGPEIPFGFEVGFTEGDAFVWYPAARLDALVLTPDPAGEPQPAEVPWVQALREMPRALWVGHGEEAERFLFYEATTREQPAVVVTRGDSWAPDRPHYGVRNRSDRAVHDLVVIADGRAWTAPTVPPGASAGFLLRDPLDADGLRRWLRSRWTDPDEPSPPADWSWVGEDCVMMRDPAVPVERAEGHRLYDAEVDVLLSVWAERLLSSDGVRLVYREDVAALDAAMPASLYTSMSWYVRWRRLGVVLVEGVSLP